MIVNMSIKLPYQVNKMLKYFISGKNIPLIPQILKYSGVLYIDFKDIHYYTFL